MTAGAEGLAKDVRTLVEQVDYGTLSTLADGGIPFGSLVGYAVDAAGCPLLFVSSLAEHTKNVHRDPRASLLVVARGEAPLEGARATLMGTIVAAPPEERATLLARYLVRHPSAARYAAFSDFGFYRLVPSRIRYVEGFGVMGFVTGADYTRA